jgi:AsmA protein
MILFLRWMVGLLFILAVSLFLLILSLPIFFNPNDYKAQLAGLVQEKTGRELLVTGDIKAQISSWLNVTCSLGKVRLANHPPFPNNTFLAIEQANIELSLLPLFLQRRLHMANITLDGVTLNLLHNKEGLNNWEQAPPLPAPAAKPEANPISTEIATEPPPDVSLQKQSLSIRMLTPFLAKLIPQAINLLPERFSGIDFGNVQLTAVTVRYENQQTDTILSYQDLHLKTGKLREKIPFPFETGFTFFVDHRITRQSDPIRSGEITMQGNASLFLQEPRLLFEDVRLEGVAKGKALPKRGLKLSASTNSDISLRPRKISIKDFTLNHEDISLQGSGTMEDIASPRFNLTLKIPECSPQPLLKQLKASHPTLQILLQHTDKISLAKGSLVVTGDNKRIDITDLSLKVDDTTFTGALACIAALDGSPPIPPAYEAAIHIDQLDYDQYAPKPRSEANDRGAGAAPLRIPVGLLKDLALQLDLQFDSLQINGMQLSQVQMKLAGKDGIIQLSPLSANLDDGSWKVESQIDVTGNIPQIQAKQQLNRLKLEPLLQALTGKAEITGSAVMEADLNSSGQDMDELLHNLNGTTRFDLTNGEVKAVTILQKIRTARTPYQEETILTEPTLAEEAAAKDATKFTRLRGTARIKDGILRNDDLKGESALMQVTGEGEIDLVNHHVDYTLQVVLAPDLGQEAGVELVGLGDTSIPYTVIGPWTGLVQEAKVEKQPEKATAQQPEETLPQTTTNSEPAPEEIPTVLPPQEQKKPETLGD